MIEKKDHIKVTFFHRNVVGLVSTLSIERLFESIRENLPNEIESKTFVSKYHSRGFTKRFFNMLEAIFHQGDINHVTGDVHFLTYFLKKHKTILTIHDCVSVEHSSGYKKYLLTLFWYILPAKKCTYITVISEKTKRDVLKLINYPEDRITVIPNGLRRGFEYREKTIFNDEPPRLLLVGTKENKNLPRICQALANMQLDYLLDIVGKLSDEQLNCLKKNNINYENSVALSDEELINKYIISDVVLFVSTYEGFGMPIIEAQAIGRPVITSNISPMKEIVGKDGCIVDPLNVKSIQSAIEKMILSIDYRMQTVEFGLQNVKKYRAENVALMYYDLYEKVIGEGKK